MVFSSSASAASPKAGDIVVQSGVVQAADGSSVPYEVGTLYVPENRQAPGSRIIGVGFARLKAKTPTGAPPVFWLPGGPGLSVLDALDSSSPAVRARLASWLTYASVGDLVVIEQRGYTVRGERLEITAPAEPLDRPATIAADIAGTIALAKAAVAAHPDKDLSGYTIAACAEDVNDLRRALGYDHLSLFGGSFGSQWSLAVMRLHPETVARAVLSSVEPLDYGYDMPSQVFAAMQRIAFDADKDAGLAPYLPEGGLMAAVRTLETRFAKAPVRVKVRGSDGKEQAIVLGQVDFQSALLEQAGDAESWPAFVLSQYYGHHEAWAQEAIEDRRAKPYKLIGPLIDTSLGETPQREFLLRNDPAVAMLGTGGFASYIASAKDWPTPDMGDAFRAFARSDIPVLLVHGDWDTSTPLENMLTQLAYFPHGRGIVVHRGGHDGVFYQLRNEPAAKSAVYAFLRTGELNDLPTEVTLPVPAFKLPQFAPPARQSAR
ncbi:alpha/beta hydrolase [Dyella sp. 2RAB6]|uniref:alpha/beta hydrolase n=1 Tax=Dyella sp. 2RAB6 TaxID=3232992 RepID=UPI003F8E04C3